eukprot:2854596-Pyramimonas_sp.AAC.1
MAPRSGFTCRSSTCAISFHGRRIHFMGGEFAQQAVNSLFRLRRVAQTHQFRPAILGELRGVAQMHQFRPAILGELRGVVQTHQFRPAIFRRAHSGLESTVGYYLHEAEEGAELDEGLALAHVRGKEQRQNAHGNGRFVT